MTERLDMERESWVRWENSFGASEPEKRTMKITAWACADRQRGGFEIYDIESGGERYYGEGGMWFGDDSSTTTMVCSHWTETSYFGWMTWVWSHLMAGTERKLTR